MSALAFWLERFAAMASILDHYAAPFGIAIGGDFAGASGHG